MEFEPLESVLRRLSVCILIVSRNFHLCVSSLGGRSVVSVWDLFESFSCCCDKPSLAPFKFFLKSNSMPESKRFFFRPSA